MKEPVLNQDKVLRAFLVGIRDEKIPKAEADSLAGELADLVYTLGLEIVSQEMVHVRENSARYGLGAGKAEELAQKAAALEADCIIFNRELSPSQQRNWEELPFCKDSGISVIDRQELIIQIFASRARTREAELQVNLAELNYTLPRLQHKYIDLSRQRGGRYGTRGSGETHLETDRRLVEERIHRLEEELEDVKRQRQVQRKQRERQGIPICALVGYTNAGKSSIFNALTGAGVPAEDKLFATLDPVSRRLELPLNAQSFNDINNQVLSGKPRAGGQKGHMQILLVDTVGFIRRLPHSLVNAFRATLEEVNHADILLNVLDASDADAAAQYAITLSVLGELGAENIPMITILNKIDRLETGPSGESLSGESLSRESLSRDSLSIEALIRRYPESVPVSAKEGRGLKELCTRIELVLAKSSIRFRFPPERPDLAALVHRSGQVISEEYGEKFIEMEARVGERTAGMLMEYQVND